MKQNMKRVKWGFGFLAAVGVPALLYLWMTLHPPLWYYQQLGVPRELPKRLIRPAVRKFAGCDMPEHCEKVRAIFHGGRDPSVIVRFQTDQEGISHIREQIAQFNLEFEPFSGTPGFYDIVSGWQEWSGIQILDQRIIESGLRARYDVFGLKSFEIIVDTQRNEVYIFAWRT